jgi:N-acyl-D-amino-acid deacylase
MLVRNGRIVDGTGNPSFVGDIAFASGKIAALGQNLHAEAAQVIDARGLVVSPGFIDAHTHCDVTAFVWPEQRNLVTQGTTTATSGQCGISAAPDSRTFWEYISTICPYSATVFWGNVLPMDEHWESQREYAAAVNRRGVAIDIVPSIGHGALRLHVGARGPEPASARQLEEMKSLLRAGLEDGANGATAGMSYDPNRFASYEEVLALARICAEYGRVYQFHAPYCANAEAARYSVRLARDSGVRFSIAHFQAPPKYWNEAEEMLAIVEEARGQGVDITFNVMQDPRMVYSANGWKSIFQWVANTYGGRSWTAEGFEHDAADPAFRKGLAKLMKEHIGQAADILPGYVEWLPTATLLRTGSVDLDGWSVADLAREHGAEPEEFVYALICGQSGLVPAGHDPILSLQFAGNEEFIGEATLHEAGMPCTDLNTNESLPGLADMTPWPGAYNTMPRFFRESRRRGMRLEEAVRHMTSLPASSMNLFDRGILREGLKADVLVFDEAAFAPQATYEDLTAPAAGLRWSFVAGVPIVQDGVQNGRLPGRMISVS